VTAPAPASMTLSIEPEDTPRIPDASIIGLFNSNPEILMSSMMANIFLRI
jgi:hypothetical protein